MQKLELSFEIKYPFLNDIIIMFEQYSDIDSVCIFNDISIHAKPLVKLIEKQFGKKLNFWNYYNDPNTYQINVDKSKAIICFSGGKDSVNVALKLKDKYDLTLYYLKGINRSYPNEIDHAKECAKALGLPLVIQECSCKGHTNFLENPLKNPFIYACALNYGLEKGITTYFFGNANDECVNNSNFDRDFSDSREVFALFTAWVSKDLDTKIINYPIIDSGIDSIVNIAKHKNIREIVQSCLLPNRFQKSTHIRNMEKYGVELPPYMCGSCWKCCVQYIVWADLGYLEYNHDFYYHCLDFLKSKSLEERGLKTKTYKETYIAFINEELYQISILKGELKNDNNR